MSFSSDALKVIQIISRTGSFSEAAKELHRVPSSVSYMVKKIEEELNVQLFNRNGKSVTPTKAADYIIEHGAWIIREIEELKRDVGQISLGVDRKFTIALNYIVNPKPMTQLLSYLLSQFPSTEFSIRTEVYNGCWDALYESRADLVIGAPQSAPHNDGISTRYMGNISWTFVVGPSHPLADFDGVLQAEDVRDFPSIVVHDSSVALNPKRTWVLKGQKIIYAADLTMVLNLISQGVGVGFLPTNFVHEAIRQRQIIAKSIIESKQPVPVYYAWRIAKEGKVLDEILRVISEQGCRESWLM